MKPARLHADVVIEPTIHQWYASVWLLAPLTAGRLLASRLLPMMDSFAAAPQVHVAALHDPGLRDGPFLELGQDRAGAVRELAARIRAEAAALLEADAGLVRLLRALGDIGAGGIPASAWAGVPEALRGRVELVYDGAHRPRLRPLEALIYRAALHGSAAQGLAITRPKGDRRPFALTTPRVAGPDTLIARVPFDDPRVDDLYALRDRPGDPRRVAEALGLEAEALAALCDVGSDPTPAHAPPFAGPGARWRSFGHAGVLVESRDATLLFDPVVSLGGPDRYAWADLPPRLDAIVLTHNHQDHVALETLLALRRRCDQVIVPRASGELHDPSIALALRSAGLGPVREVDPFDEARWPGARLIALPFLGEHADLDVRARCTYALEIAGHRLGLIADAGCPEPALYAQIRQQIGAVDVLFLGMECEGAPFSWLYGPHALHPLTRAQDQARRLSGADRAQALDIVAALGCRQVWVYGMGTDPWVRHVIAVGEPRRGRAWQESEAFLAACAGRGVVAGRVQGRMEGRLDER